MPGLRVRATRDQEPDVSRVRSGVRPVQPVDDGRPADAARLGEAAARSDELAVRPHPQDADRRRDPVGLVSPTANPWPLLFLGLYWLRWAVPPFVRRIARRRIVWRVPPAVRHCSAWTAPAIRRLRRMFGVALLLLVLHVPFFAAFAVSYPFFARSAKYWLTVAPYTENPRPAPASTARRSSCTAGPMYDPSSDFTARRDNRVLTWTRSGVASGSTSYPVRAS